MEFAFLFAFLAYVQVFVDCTEVDLKLPDLFPLEDEDVSALFQEPDPLFKDIVAFYEEVTCRRLTPYDLSTLLLKGDRSSEEANFGSDEAHKRGEMISRMKDDIAEIEAVFVRRVSPTYDGMSNRKLWRELIKKQKKLEAVKAQLQHLLNVKQEKLNKLNGRPSRFNIPSQELSKAILSDIDEIIAFRPEGYNKKEEGFVF